MTKKYDTLVFCGRFQPFHKGHEKVVKEAIKKAFEVVIVIGSSFQPRTPKNPFTFVEREAMIKAVFPQASVKVVGVMDYPYDDNAWVSAVQGAVDSVKTGVRTGLIGHSKDSSSYYLDIFPDWNDHVEVENVGNINATDIRNDMYNFGIYRGTDTEYSNKLIPDEVNYIIDDIIEEWAHKEYADILLENAQIKEYVASWESAPFRPTFITTDALITQSGYALLIERGGFPFKGCYALPGGYLDANQTIVANMIKELREETCVKLPVKVIKGSIVKSEIFDAPDRDPRGRTITHAFHIDLGYPKEKLPKVKGADDAAKAVWVPLSSITSDMMSFDHYHIIKRFIPTYGAK